MHDNGPEEVCDDWIWEPDLFVAPMSRNPRDMAMEAKLTDHVWSIEELVGLLEACEYHCNGHSLQAESVAR